MADYHLAVENVTKAFGDLLANDGVNLHVRHGSVHAILGENGAGKSTLMNILYGLYQPDEGEIRIEGRAVRIDDPKTALAHGIGMVHQHFMLVGPFTVTENVVLGMARGARLDLAEHARRLTELSDSFGFDVDPGEPVWRLPMGVQQRVEILKLLYHNADILILDEPTSVLTPAETGPFFEVLRRLTQAGKTILFITHKLEEVMTISDRVTVMRGGRVTAELATADVDAGPGPRELARLMIGRDTVFDVSRAPRDTQAEVALRVQGLHAVNERGLTALDDVSFELHAGEILGVAGVDGNGQSELAEVVSGLRPPTAGRILVRGEDITGASVAQRKHRYGIGYVPEDRQRVGLVLQHEVSANLMLRDYDRAPYTRKGLLDFGAIREHAERLAKRFDVRLQSVSQQAAYLSGGNQQKVILARELDGGPTILIVAQPTKGLDVGAIEFVQNTLLEQRGRGVAILYISTELEHLRAVSDRIAVIFRGRIDRILDAGQATSEELGLLMAGAGREVA